MAASTTSEKPLEIVFRPCQAVGIFHLRNPRNPGPEIDYLRHELPDVDVRVDLKVDVLLLKLPDSALREVTDFAVKNKIARHEALVLLVKSGLAGVDMAERLIVYRQVAMQLDIADALEPIRSSRKARSQAAYKDAAERLSVYRRAACFSRSPESVGMLPVRRSKFP